jgi:hypothetical protein
VIKLIVKFVINLNDGSKADRKVVDISTDISNFIRYLEDKLMFVDYPDLKLHGTDLKNKIAVDFHGINYTLTIEKGDNLQ